AAGPTADLVHQFALPVPSMVICHLLGVPYADHDFFQNASRRMVQGIDAQSTVAARQELAHYMGGLVDKFATEPGPGLLSTLVTEQMAKGAIDRDDLAMDAVLVLIAGHETTASMTSLSVITLLEHPDQLAALRADP
ncbi:cytochrome P450, partial [Streptomyces varsoviensis]